MICFAMMSGLTVLAEAQNKGCEQLKDSHTTYKLYT